MSAESSCRTLPGLARIAPGALRSYHEPRRVVTKRLPDGSIARARDRGRKRGNRRQYTNPSGGVKSFSPAVPEAAPGHGAGAPAPARPGPAGAQEKKTPRGRVAAKTGGVDGTRTRDLLRDRQAF